jgi:hypothetical protein
MQHSVQQIHSKAVHNTYNVLRFVMVVKTMYAGDKETFDSVLT